MNKKLNNSCCNCGTKTTTKNKYGFECLKCKNIRILTFKKLIEHSEQQLKIKE